MGFKAGASDVPGLSTAQRVHLLCQSTCLNSISWAIGTIRAHKVSLDLVSQRPIDCGQRSMGFTSSQTLPSMEDRPNLTCRGTTRFPWTLHNLLLHNRGPPNMSSKTEYTEMVLIPKVFPTKRHRWCMSLLEPPYTSTPVAPMRPAPSYGQNW
jgi:hypothetical protein